MITLGAIESAGLLTTMTPHWTLLTICVGLAAYLSGVGMAIRKRIAEGEGRNEKGETIRISDAQHDKHLANLRGIIVGETMLLVLAVVTAARILIPVLEEHADAARGGLWWLMGLLAAGAAICFLLALFSDESRWMPEGAKRQKRTQTGWMWVCAGVVLMISAAATGGAAWLIPWRPCPWVPTPPQTDAFLLAGLMVTVICLGALHLRQWRGPRR